MQLWRAIAPAPMLSPSCGHQLSNRQGANGLGAAILEAGVFLTRFPFVMLGFNE